jgi:hypothetical protein
MSAMPAAKAAQRRLKFILASLKSVCLLYALWRPGFEQNCASRHLEKPTLRLAKVTAGYGKVRETGMHEIWQAGRNSDAGSDACS